MVDVIFTFTIINITFETLIKRSWRKVSGMLMMTLLICYHGFLSDTKYFRQFRFALFCFMTFSCPITKCFFFTKKRKPVEHSCVAFCCFRSQCKSLCPYGSILHLHRLALGKVPFWLVAVFAYVASYTTSLFRNITPSRLHFARGKDSHNWFTFSLFARIYTPSLAAALFSICLSFLLSQTHKQIKSCDVWSTVPVWFLLKQCYGVTATTICAWLSNNLVCTLTSKEYTWKGRLTYLTHVVDWEWKVTKMQCFAIPHPTPHQQTVSSVFWTSPGTEAASSMMEQLTIAVITVINGFDTQNGKRPISLFCI